MPDNRVQIRVTADLSSIVEATEKSTAQMKQHFEGMRGAGKPLDDALLSNRESVRLLSEEMGIHLPRAVSGALAEIMPAIGSMGTALLGVFAVEEVIKFGEQVKKIADDFNEIGQSEKNVAEVAKEVEGFMERIARKSSAAAQAELRQLNAMIVAQEASVEALRNHEDGLDRISPIAQTVQQAYFFWTGHSKDLTKSEEQLNRQYELRNKLLEILTEDEEKAHKKSDAAAKKAAAEAARRAREWAELEAHADAEDQRLLKRMQEWRTEWLKAIGMPEEAKFSLQEITRNINSAGLEASKSLPSLTALGTGFHKLTEEERAMLPLSASVDSALMRQAAAIHAEAEAINADSNSLKRIQVEYQKRIQLLDREIAKERELYQQHKITRAQMEADEQAYTQVVVEAARVRKEAEMQAAEATAQAMVSEIGTFVGAIAGRKAQAEIEGAFYLAEGAFDVARGVWPPNPGLIARGLGEIGAGIEMLKVGGGGGGSSRGVTAGPMSGGGGGTGGGGYAGHDSYGAGAYSTSGLAPGAAAAKAAGLASQAPSQIVIHMNFNSTVVGGRAGAKELTGMVAQEINRRVVGSDMKLIASHVVNPAPIARGRS